MSDWVVVGMTLGMGGTVLAGVGIFLRARGRGRRRQPPSPAPRLIRERRLNRTAEVLWFDGEPTMEYMVQIPEDRRMLN